MVDHVQLYIVNFANYNVFKHVGIVAVLKLQFRPKRSKSTVDSYLFLNDFKVV